MSTPVSEEEHGRLYLSGLCANAAEFLLRGALAEQWSMAREMVINDLADWLRETAEGKPVGRTRRTNVPREEWDAWADASAKEAAPHAVYREALAAVKKAVLAAFYPSI